MRTALLLLGALALALVVFLLVRADDAGRGGAGRRAVEDELLREKVIALFLADDKPRAVAELAPLLAREDAALEDLTLGAALALQVSDLDAARALVERGRAIAPDDPALGYLAARIADNLGELDTVVGELRAVLERAPDDLASKLVLATALSNLDTETDAEALANEREAVRLCKEILEVGSENGTVWYFSAAYRLYTMATMAGDEDAAQRWGELYKTLERRGLTGVNEPTLNQGTLAQIVAPRPRGTEVATEPALPSFAADAPILPELAGAEGVLLDDLDGDRWLDIVAWGSEGLFVTRGTGAERDAVRVREGPVRFARTVDLNDAASRSAKPGAQATGDSLDLLVAEGDALVLLEQSDADGSFAPSPVTLPRLPSPALDAVFVDFDHEGDLDLLVVGAFGARLYRNDGAGRLIQDGEELPRGVFADVTAEAGLGPESPFGEPAGRAFTWCATEDFDEDQDVDLLMGGPGVLFLASNLRAGRFEDATARVFGDAVLPRAPLLADLDGDARVDAFAPGAPSTLWMQTPAGSMERRATEIDVPEGAPVAGVDLDLDGSLDAVWPGPDGILASGVLALGLPQQTPFALGGGGSGPLALGDVDFVRGRPNEVEIVQVGADGVRVWRPEGPVGHAARFKFVGVKDNRQAVGAIVEVRAGPIYRRVYWRGPAVVVGVGEEPFLDVVRVTWPNGVVQSDLDVALGDQFFIDDDSGIGRQREGLVGSCPFLYTWNGETFEFVTDVLGITPLGLPMAPGLLVPPDHDEYVLVRGDQLVARDGFLELQITEELREVTYLDRVRLDVVDHPAGTEIYPDERFTFPPFPPPHTHTVRDARAPLSATGSDGRDWTAALARIDDVHAVPFEARGGQHQGLAGPHWLELDFGPALARSERLRLVCTGWFRWSDASVNMAAARTPGVEFVPPIVQVPDAQGGWSDAGPPVGFPAGKTKTMVIDVTGLVRPDDPRLRLFSTLELYWDSIRLADEPEDEALVVTPLEPASARLWWRGFSAPLDTDRADLPERFTWDELDPEPRWSQHPGRYTRYGETLPLLTAIDDRFVVFGAGDALTVRFDARALAPPAPGHVRDYLVFLDGWAKDRDPNTLEALNVEPLPFHGMSGYPYGPDERFPDDESHRRWRAEWQTREAHPAVVPLSPKREVDWALR